MTDGCRIPSIDWVLRSIAPPGILARHRVIQRDDERGLLPEEQRTVWPDSAKARRHSGAARIVARHLLAVGGFGCVALPRSSSGAPIWPTGIVGSLAHDDDVAVAAIAPQSAFSALGIDIEPAVPLPPGVSALVATPAERRRYGADLIESPLFFVAKEAIYKALRSQGGAFIDFLDVELDLSRRLGVTRDGDVVELAFTLTPRVIALAFKWSPANERGNFFSTNRRHSECHK
jgi:4'-phosphopantetheinyl transferase EntD